MNSSNSSRKTMLVLLVVQYSLLVCLLSTTTSYGYSTLAPLTSKSSWLARTKRQQRNDNKAMKSSDNNVRPDKDDNDDSRSSTSFFTSFNESHNSIFERRAVLSFVRRVGGAVFSSNILSSTTDNLAYADDGTTTTSAGSGGVYTRELSKEKIKYTFVPPSNFEAGNKPLKTHLDEINFISQDIKGYQIGITVDPVRISTIKEFGTPEEVAAKVVTAEVNRDGIFNVKLIDDPIERKSADGSSSIYELNYLSEGKRGNKHFLVNILIDNFKLYVITGQIKEENYDTYKDELLKSIQSFSNVN